MLLGKKDADIAYWKSSLPDLTFSHYVSAILSAEIKKKIADIPVPQEKRLLPKEMDLTLYVRDRQVIRLIEGIPKMERGKYIRKVIRKHINANYRSNISQSDIENQEVVKPEETERKDQPEAVSDYRAKIMKMTGH